ncbi:MAG: tyrosine-type recombinase/integrase [Flavobacteriaceae bacterium]
MSQFLAFTDYLSLEKNYSTHTVKAYLTDLQTFSEYCLQNYDSSVLLDCNYSQIRSWIVSMVEAGISHRTINRKISSLKSYYKFLLKTGQIDVSPLVKHKALKVSKKVQVPFSVQEMKKVLEWLEFEDSFEGVRDKLMIELLYATGMRKAELIELKLSSIDLQNNTIKILGKRNKERMVPLLPSVVKNVVLYLERRKKVCYDANQGYLFLTNKGAKVYDSLVYRIINLYFSKASSKLKKSPHVLRHTFATHLLNEGADLNAVKELLGHTSLAATQVYVHNSMSRLKEVYKNSHPRNSKT